MKKRKNEVPYYFKPNKSRSLFHIDLIDLMTPLELEAEVLLIKNKKSNFSFSERTKIMLKFEHLKNKNIELDILNS